MNLDVNLVVENVIRNKNGIMIIANMIVKNNRILPMQRALCLKFQHMCLWVQQGLRDWQIRTKLHMQLASLCHSIGSYMFLLVFSLLLYETILGRCFLLFEYYFDILMTSKIKLREIDCIYHFLDEINHKSKILKS